MIHALGMKPGACSSRKWDVGTHNKDCFLGVFTGGSEIEQVCLHAEGWSVGTKSVVKRSSATHYTPGDSIMTAWWGKERFVVQYVCVLPFWVKKEWGEKCRAAWDEKITRTSSVALLRYTKNTHLFHLFSDQRSCLPCYLMNINSACCDANGWQGSSHLYALSLLSVQQLQQSHGHMTAW